MKIYYIDINREKRNTAGAKAPDDIAKLCQENGYERIEVSAFPAKKSRIYQVIWLLFICTFEWKNISKNIDSDSIIIYQHPSYGKRIAEKMIPKIQRKKNCKFIAVIHDLESLRGGIKGVIEKNSKTNEIGDNILLKHFDIIICHNMNMKQYLVTQGFKEEKIITLEIFDYLCDIDRIQPSKSKVPSIAIAGNLAVGKCQYIYEILDSEQSHNNSLIVNLFGINYNNLSNNKNLKYHGSFKPEELAKYLIGDFGLVWDGKSAKSCIGNTGEYLKYNNPHKTSLYLSSNMPVIVWKQAAIADFILSNKVGIAVDNLYDLQNIINSISEEDYKKMCNNASRIGHNLRKGFYFNKAINMAIDILNS